MSKIYNVGLIGYGIAGQVFHAPIINAVQSLRLSKIRETKAPNVQLAKSRYTGVDIVDNSEAIINDESIDLVVVATPNLSHYSLAKQALEAGKHVVVDKPFTITSADANELIELARNKGKVLSVYHNRRFDSVAKTVRKVIASGMLGPLVEYEAHYDRFRNYHRPDAWREKEEPGSGILYDLGAHMIDEAQVLFGIPKEIYADLRIQRPGGKAVDNFEVVLGYDNLKVTLKAGMLVKEPGPVVCLYGFNGSFIKHGMDVQEEALKAGFMPETAAAWGIEPEDIWGTINTDFNDMSIIGKIKSEPGDYREYYQNIAKAVSGEEELIVKPEQAAVTIRIIELAMQSSAERRTVYWDN